MRVIAGRLGGRQFVSPRGHRTHPMADKVRGALFNALGDISGLSILDAFAGSGALAFEAISRGAATAVAIDNDKSAQRAIEENIRDLKVGGQVKLVRAAAGAWLSTTDQIFDIVLADPPYDDLHVQLLSELAERVKPGGLYVISAPPNTALSLPPSLQEVARKNYGDAELAFYRRLQ